MKFIVTKYRIVGCWYGRKTPDKAVNALAVKDILSGFHKWVGTIPHMSHAEITGADCHPFRVFVKDCAAVDTDYLVALWLSSTNGDGSVYAIDINSPPNGTQNIKKSGAGKGMLAGFPAYFLIDSSECCLYTMRPSFSVVNGRSQFDATMRFYMARHSGTIGKTISVSEDGTNNIALKMLDADEESLAPMFKSSLEKVPSAVEELKKEYWKIRKIVHTQNIARKSDEEKHSIISRMFKIIDIDVEGIGEKEVTNSRRVKCEVDVRLKENDVDRIIARQSEAGGNERFGFMMTGSSQTRWADTCISRKIVDLAVEGVDDLPPKAEIVLSEVRKNRELIIG